MHLLPGKPVEVQLFVSRGFLITTSEGSGSEKPPEGGDTLMWSRAVRAAERPELSSREDRGYLGYCDSGNSSRQPPDPGIRTSCSRVFFSSTCLVAVCRSLFDEYSPALWSDSVVGCRWCRRSGVWYIKVDFLQRDDRQRREIMIISVVLKGSLVRPM